MKQVIILIALCFSAHIAFSQTDRPKEITPQILKELKAEVEEQIPTLKQSLAEKVPTADQIEFTLDTFRIERLVAKRMDIDYSTQGMSTTIEEMTASYDKLMNKYYNKLLKILTPEDRKVLINAQRHWLAYRDAEAELIAKVTNEECAGGGTIQYIIVADFYSDMVVKRTIEIFEYYDRLH